MKAKLPVWAWWLAVAVALILAVREVSWLDERITQHRAQRQAAPIAKDAEGSAPASNSRKQFPIPISGFGPL